MKTETDKYIPLVRIRLVKEKVYIPTNPHEKAMQRALIQYKKPEHYELVKEALLKVGRGDLIGFDKNEIIDINEKYVFYTSLLCNVDICRNKKNNTD